MNILLSWCVWRIWNPGCQGNAGCLLCIKELGFSLKLHFFIWVCLRACTFECVYAHVLMCVYGTQKVFSWESLWPSFRSLQDTVKESSENKALCNGYSSKLRAQVGSVGKYVTFKYLPLVGCFEELEQEPAVYHIRLYHRLFNIAFRPQPFGEKCTKVPRHYVFTTLKQESCCNIKESPNRSTFMQTVQTGQRAERVRVEALVNSLKKLQKFWFFKALSPVQAQNTTSGSYTGNTGTADHVTVSCYYFIKYKSLSCSNMQIQVMWHQVRGGACGFGTFLFCLLIESGLLNINNNVV